MAQSKVVSAAMVAVTTLDISPEGRMRAKALESVMAQAVTDAMDEGITDPDVHKKRMLAARADFKSRPFIPSGMGADDAGA